MPTLTILGVLCIAAAIIGGGVKASSVEVPLISSPLRQLLLGLLGLGLIGFDQRELLVGQQPSSPAATETSPPPDTATSNGTAGGNESASISDIAPPTSDKMKIQPATAEATSNPIEAPTATTESLPPPSEPTLDELTNRALPFLIRMNESGFTGPEIRMEPGKIVLRYSAQSESSPMPITNHDRDVARQLLCSSEQVRNIIERKKGILKEYNKFGSNVWIGYSIESCH